MCYIFGMKTDVLHTRIAPSLKKQAESVFDQIGISSSDAIRIFFKQVILRKGLPFDVVVPTTTTKRAFEASEAGRELVVCEDANDMFRKLGI